MQNAQPFHSHKMIVEPEWIDFNGHLNMAYYNVLFDRAVDQFHDTLGINADYIGKRRLTTYAAEVHVCYVRELHEGAEVTVSVQILEFDEKRIRYFQEMRHADGWLAATSEGLTLHIDLRGPKVAPFPADILEKVQEIGARHAALPVPERAGRAIRLSRKQAG